jgi:hypothetical protein
MAEAIQNYNFPIAKFGNTFDAIAFTLPEEPLYSLTEAKIYMQLRKKPGDNCMAEFSTENEKIQVISPSVFRFMEQVIEVLPDTYYYDILIVFADGRRETYIGGQWTILTTVTRKKP